MNFKPSTQPPSINSVTKGFAVGILAAVLSTGTLADPPGGKGKDKMPPGQSRAHQQQGASPGNSGSSTNDRLSGDLVTAGISVAAASLLVDDLGIQRSGYNPLPPGIRKNLARGKPLPPGIAKSRLPGSMINRLPSYPGYEWIGAGTDLLLVNIASQVIADVLIDVFR